MLANMMGLCCGIMLTPVQHYALRLGLLAAEECLEASNNLTPILTQATQEVPHLGYSYISLTHV
eukprot:2283709-Amphidinium_carterae.1